MISDTEKAILEIGSGAWFITSAALVLVFGFFVAERLIFDRDWPRSPTVRAAAALIIYGVGSALRAGLAWFRFAHGDFGGASFILTWWPWFEVSILMNAFGAAFAIYVLAPRYRICLAAAVTAAAFIIPALIWAL